MPKMLRQQNYAALASDPGIQRMMDSPPLSGNAIKQPFISGDERWPSTPIPPEIAKSNINLKKRIRIMRVFHRISLTILALCATALEGQMLYTYLHTRNIHREGRGPWATQTSLWPSILLLTSSATTALIGFIVLASYAHSIRTANHLAMVNALIIITVEVAGFITWVVVAILYRTGKNGKDLWGWACSPGALRIQPGFAGVLSFEKLCKKGETNWALSLASAGVNVFSLMVWYFVWRRRKLQKMEQKILREENNSAEAIQGIL